MSDPTEPTIQDRLATIANAARQARYQSTDREANAVIGACVVDVLAVIAQQLQRIADGVGDDNISGYINTIARHMPDVVDAMSSIGGAVRR